MTEDQRETELAMETCLALPAVCNAPAKNLKTESFATRLGAWRRELSLPLRVAFYCWAGPVLHELGYA